MSTKFYQNRLSLRFVENMIKNVGVFSVHSVVVQQAFLSWLENAYLRAVSVEFEEFSSYHRILKTAAAHH